MIKLVFFGNTKYSRIVEETLFKTFGLNLVITLPDRPVGRKKIMTPTPVKEFALQHNIPILETEKLDKTAIDKIKEFEPDFLVVADYGLILPKELLELPKYAPLNVHHSLLPKYRGPSPAPTAILNGDKVSGVTVIRMTEQLDAGPILAQKEYMLKPDETTDSLLTKLNELGAELASSIIRTIELHKPIEEKNQDESKASFTKRISKQDGFIDLENPPSREKIDRMIKAYYPWPNVWSELRIRNKELRIKFLPDKKIQAEGKNPVSFKDFLNGYPEAKEIITRISNN